MELYCIVHCTEVMDININPRVHNDTYISNQTKPRGWWEDLTKVNSTQLTSACDDVNGHTLKLHANSQMITFTIICPASSLREPYMYPLSTGQHICQHIMMYYRIIEAKMVHLCHQSVFLWFGVYHLQYLFVTCCVLSHPLGLPLYTTGTGCSV